MLQIQSNEGLKEITDGEETRTLTFNETVGFASVPFGKTYSDSSEISQEVDSTTEETEDKQNNQEDKQNVPRQNATIIVLIVVFSILLVTLTAITVLANIPAVRKVICKKALV